MNLSKSYQTITHFRLQSFILKIIVYISGPISDIKNQGNIFLKMQPIVQKYQQASLDQLEEILDAFKEIENIKSIEVLNPSNGNGFIFSYESES